MAPLLDRAFRKLSTGETRKLLLVRALSSRPDLLVLDEPFDGLDAASHERLASHLVELADRTRVVLVLNRLDEAPGFVTHVAWVEGGASTPNASGEGRLRATLRHDDPAAREELRRLLHLKTGDLELPPPEKGGPAARSVSPTVRPISSGSAIESSGATGRDATDGADATGPESAKLDTDVEPLVRLTGATIRYGDAVVFEDIDWTIRRGEHWQLVGPNGSGKTGLLSLITGDHPQCYVNDIVAFGYRRGSGESVWDIKRHIGYVSTALQWEYTVGTGLRNVIVSGFHDSIGLYTKASEEQRRIADAWLALLGMGGRADESFNRLSHGDRRLVLIARAMVKHPPLLILDEPCLGLDDVNRQLVLALIERVCAGRHDDRVVRQPPRRRPDRGDRATARARCSGRRLSLNGTTSHGRVPSPAGRSGPPLGSCASAEEGSGVLARDHLEAQHADPAQVPRRGRAHLVRHAAAEQQH